MVEFVNEFDRRSVRPAEAKPDRSVVAENSRVAKTVKFVD